MNHYYCSMDSSGGWLANDVCPQCGQCSPSAMLVQNGHDKMKHRVWKQRKDIDREAANDEVIAFAAMKQKAANGESIAKQKVTADANRQGLERTSGESVMIQAAKSISRSSHELRI